VGHRATFTIRLRDLENGSSAVGHSFFLAFEQHGAGASTELAEQPKAINVREVGDGDYAASYTPLAAGELLMSVTMQLISATGVEEMHISGSPFRVKVDAAGIHAPSCTAAGTGVAPSFARTSQATFAVTARDAAGEFVPNGLAGPVGSIDPFLVDVTFVSKGGMSFFPPHFSASD
jgi:hypothetical protein